MSTFKLSDKFNIDRSLIDTSQKLLFVFSKKFEKIFLKM